MKLKNELGISFVEILIAAALVGGGALILTKGTSILTGSKVARKSSIGLQLLNEDLLATSTNLLTGIANEQGKKRNGICSMVSTNSKTPGVAQIFINVSRGTQIFNNNTWNNKYRNWEVQSDKRCKNLSGWNKCFRLKEGSINAGLTPKQMADLDLAASVEVIPVGMNPYKSPNGKLFYKVDVANNKNMDVKDISFKVRTTLYYNKAETPQKKIQEDLIWASSVGTCDGNLANKTKSEVKLSLSGMGASDPTGRTIYNRSGFTGNEENPVRVNWRRTVAQAGVVLENGRYITTDKTKNIYGSCNEVTYKCPQVTAKKREYGPINMIMNLTLNTQSVLGKNSLVKAKPKFSIKKGESRNIVDENKVTFIVDNRNQVGKDEDLTMSGSHSININVQETSRGENNNLCRQICHEGNGYNQTGATYGDKYSPYLNLDFYEFDKNFNYSSNQGLGCTACYMKNCAQFGLGTFGPMHEMPGQPQDAPVPECHQYEPKTPKFSPFYFAKFKLKNAPKADTDPTCIKARLDPTTNNLILDTENCAKQMPVMCFNFGRYLLARDVFSQPETLSRVKFEEAHRRCFETGREVSDPEKLREFAGNPGLDLPLNQDGNFDFFNLANQGSFLAPQLSKDIEQFAQWMNQNGLSPSTWFWISMVRDGKGKARLLPPRVPEFKPSDNNALFYLPSRNLHLKKHDEKIAFTDDPGINNYLYTHHIKFKGLIPVRNQEPAGSRRFPFLCRKKDYQGEFFLSQLQSTKFEKGEEACKKEKGLFLPPNSTTQWVVAYNLINEFHPQYAFPNPWQDKIAQIPFAWVALESMDPSIEKFNELRLPNIFNYKKLGEVKSFVPDFGTQDIIVINGDGDYIDPRAIIEGKKLKPSKTTDIKIKDGVYFKYTLNTNDSEKVVLNDTGAEIKMSLVEIVDKINANMTKARLSIRDDGGDSIVTLTPNAIYSKQRLEITGSVDQELGFRTNHLERSPNFDFLCVKDDGAINRVPDPSVCTSGFTPHFNEVQDSLDYQIGFNLMDYDRKILLGFKNN